MRERGKWRRRRLVVRFCVLASASVVPSLAAPLRRCSARWPALGSPVCPRLAWLLLSTVACPAIGSAKSLAAW